MRISTRIRPTDRPLAALRAAKVLGRDGPTDRPTSTRATVPHRGRGGPTDRPIRGALGDVHYEINFEPPYVLEETKVSGLNSYDARIAILGTFGSQL